MRKKVKRKKERKKEKWNTIIDFSLIFEVRVSFEYKPSLVVHKFWENFVSLTDIDFYLIRKPLHVTPAKYHFVFVFLLSLTSTYSVFFIFRKFESS